LTEKDFILNWINKLSNEGIKIFPKDFCSFTNFNELKLPSKSLVLGKEFFGNYEILSIDGDSVFQAENIGKAKFILYANRLKPNSIKIPLSEVEIKNTITDYESYLDSLLRQIENDYKNSFNNGKNYNSVANEIFKRLNLIRL
jgi:hypothetical protein